MRVSLLAALAVSVVSVSAMAQDLEDPYGAPPPEQQPAQPTPPPLPAYAPLKAVGIMIETQQALFWDEQAGEYRLGKLGGEVAGWRLVAIQPDRVILLLGDARDEIPLTPAPTFYRHVPSPKRVPPVIIVAPPVGGPAATPPQPPAPAIVPPSTPPAPVTTAPPVVVTPPPPLAPPAVKKPIESRHKLARAELDRQLGDFDALLATVSLAPADGGGFRVLTLDEKSWLASLGFKPGDIVRSVAGDRVVTVDDAARVYARVLTSKTFVIEVDRGEDRLNMRFDVR